MSRELSMVSQIVAVIKARRIDPDPEVTSKLRVMLVSETSRPPEKILARRHQIPMNEKISAADVETM